MPEPKPEPCAVPAEAERAERVSTIPIARAYNTQWSAHNLALGDSAISTLHARELSANDGARATEPPKDKMPPRGLQPVTLFVQRFAADVAATDIQRAAKAEGYKLSLKAVHQSRYRISARGLELGTERPAIERGAPKRKASAVKGRIRSPLVTFLSGLSYEQLLLPRGELQRLAAASGLEATLPQVTDARVRLKKYRPELFRAGRKSVIADPHGALVTSAGLARAVERVQPRLAEAGVDDQTVIDQFRRLVVVIGTARARQLLALIEA